MGSMPRMKTRALLAWLVLSIFILQPAAALAESPMDLPAGKLIQMPAAENPVPANSGEQQAAVSLEQAIGIARETFEVPEVLNEFSTGFDQGKSGSFWDLRWYRSSEPGGEMNVRVNSETGEIWSMGQWISPAPGQEYQGLPRYTREQVEGAAAALAEKLQPKRFKLTRLQPALDNDYHPLPLVKRGQVEYQYEYARIIDGVPYTQNGISVSVSGDTGQVTRFELRWDDTKGFPAAAGMISQQQAEQIFRSETGPELYYFRERVPGGREVPLKLVYRLPGQQNRAVIDALSGKVLSREDEFYAYYDMAAGGGGEMKMAGNQAAIPLSPVEEIAVEEAKSLLSREKAQELAMSAVKVPGEYVLNNSRLEQDYMFKNQKMWHFNWETGSGAERKAMDITVNAVSGELISFNTGSYYTFYEPSKSPEVKFSEEEALKIAGEYVKKVQPARWGEVVYNNARPDYYPVIDKEGISQPRSYNFNWARLAKGVQFPDNGFYVVVDSATGEITSYRMTWWDVEFPGVQGVMSREEAANRYLGEAPLTTAYMRLWMGSTYSKISEEGEVHLVYYTARQNFTMLDAFTGQLLDYNGNAVTPSYKDQKFDDLDSHSSREAVELLARSGIVAPVGGKFRPDDNVTQAELITMLVKSRTYSPMPVYRASVTGKEPWYQQYYDMAARLGIIQAGENPDPDLPVTREVMARLTIHTMDLYKVARLSDIYVLNFNDAGDITENLRGHVALAVGLGLIEPVDGDFGPKAVVTRGEAAETLVRILKSN